MIEEYRRLDRFGKELVQTVVSMEATRVGAASKEETSVSAPKKERGESARILRTADSRGRYAGAPARTEKRSILLYDLPVSAGVGVYLDETAAESISVPNTEKTAEADYALRISGDSMEPKYHDGDVLLVKETDSVDVGELGIFLLDGCGFFKAYGGDRLLSLNPDYAPILLKDFSDIQCKGAVVGKLKRK